MEDCNRMDRFLKIKEKLIQYANSDEDIKGIIAFGSSTRDEEKADEYSDLDLLIVSTNIDKWYSGEYPSLLGDMNISFIEPTLGGGKERRCIYGDSLDVDMIVFTPAQFTKALEDGVAEWVLNRGYTLLYDSEDYADAIKKYVRRTCSKPDMSENEFNNMVNDFYFHNIWACKKLLRGEIWSAKMCVDAYLKNYLLKMIELYCSKVTGVDVWHDGRFIDKWATDDILEQLGYCFAHYNKDDIFNALNATSELFTKLAVAVASKESYAFPDKARECARMYLLNANK